MSHNNKNHSNQNNNIVKSHRPKLKRYPSNDPLPPVKRIKTSYFDTLDTITKNHVTGRTHRQINTPPTENDKIIFLVSNKPSDDLVDNQLKNPDDCMFDGMLFNDKEFVNFLRFMNDDRMNLLTIDLISKDPPKVPGSTSPKKSPTIISTQNTKKRPNSSKPPEKLSSVPLKTIHTCNNPLCNHKTEKEDISSIQLIDIPLIKSIDDLITLGKAYHCKKRLTYKGLNLRLMCDLVQPLTELKDMIGMKDVKAHIVDQILFFLQGFNTVKKCNKCQDCIFNLPCVQKCTEMMHTVITGPPGVGKTCLGRIMGSLYKAMGILSNGKFHEVTRADFLAGYLGQTAIKTQELIDKCAGGVMFIDEAYSMGSKENRDSFAKEALDTLNQNLSNKRDLLCIIAGYEKEIEKCFFSVNDGLKRRFTFRYNIAEYDYNELLDIFKLKVQNENWSIDFNSDEPAGVIRYTDTDLLNLFRSNKESFPYCGGDIETYFLQCKIAHGRRIPGMRKCLSYNDLKNGFVEFTKNRKTKKIKKDDEDDLRPNMYNLK